MNYAAQSWNNGAPGGTPLSAERLNHIEQGIDALSAALETLPQQIAAIMATNQSIIDAAILAMEDIDGSVVTSLTDRIDGVELHEDVSGTLILDPAKGYHVVTPSGTLELQLGVPPGNSIAVKVVSGAEDVTFDGLPDLVLTDDSWVTFVYYDGAWSLASSGATGGGTVEPVTEPPTQPGVVTIDPTAVGFNLSWVASTVAAGYEGSVDGGAYADYGANLTEVLTGYTAGSTHSGTIRAYNSLGQRSSVRTWGPATTDSVPLHDQLLALNPTIYLRTTEGSLEDFSEVPAVWTVRGGASAAAFNGPPLVEGDTASMKIGPNVGYQRPADDVMVGATSFTMIWVTHAPLDVTQGGGDLKWGDFSGLGSYGWASESYATYKPGGVHTNFGVWDPATTGASTRGWLDGNEGDSGTTYGALNDNPMIGASPGIFYLHGNQHGGINSDAGYLGYMVLLKNRVLTHAERVAIATAAGTIGNPPEGTLP